MKKPTEILEHVERISRFKDQIRFRGDYIRLKEYAQYLIKAIDKCLEENASYKESVSFYAGITHTPAQIKKLRRQSVQVK